jgi:type II secretory pathway component GspD/PulD (secretin)
MHAQSQPADTKPGPSAYQTLYLTSGTDPHEANDIVTDLRNMLPNARLYSVESQNAISIRASAEDIQTAQRILADIDPPRKLYRLTYSLNDMDGGKVVGTQKVSIIVPDSGENTVLKQGSKVPIVTGTSDAGSSAQNSQVQYIDVGLTIEASVNGSPDGASLRTKVAQSSVLDERAASSTGDPSIRQTVLDGSASLVPGKPLVLGSLDIPGSAHREEISVVSELIH